MTAAGWLGLLGLGQRAGSVIVGTTGVRAGLQRGEVVLVVLAADPSPRTKEKVERLALGRNVPVLTGPPAATLGQVLGRDTVQAVGVCDRRLAAGVLARAAGSEQSNGGTG